MSDSIWHKASEKPELNKYVVARKHGFAQWKVFKFDNKTTFYEPFTDDLWAYMADVITQADKAELQTDKVARLEKENEAMREEFEVWHGNYECEVEEKERLQKAVDLAQERLLSISDGYDIMKTDAETIKRLFYAIQDEASETYKEIKQLIKETADDNN